MDRIDLSLDLLRLVDQFLELYLDLYPDLLHLVDLYLDHPDLADLLHLSLDVLRLVDLALDLQDLSLGRLDLCPDLPDVLHELLGELQDGKLLRLLLLLRVPRLLLLLRLPPQLLRPELMTGSLSLMEFALLPGINFNMNNNRPRNEGDNLIGSVRPSVRLCAYLSELSCLNCLTFDLDFWHGGRP